MTPLPRIGIIGGNGIIGGAFARALVDSGAVAAADLVLSCRSTPPGWLPGARWVHDNAALVAASELVVVSVRPQDWPALALRAEGRLVVSVMASVPLAALVAGTGSTRVVRTLPNAAAAMGASYTPWIASADVTDADRAVLRRILTACGTEDEVADEASIDYLGGLTGTGPAYPALLASALIEDATARGLPLALARRAVTQLLIGTGRFYEVTGEDPAETVQGFVDYAGITAAALTEMRRAGLPEAVKAGLAAAVARTAEMAGEGG